MMDDLEKLMMILETGLNYPPLESKPTPERATNAHNFAVSIICAVVINLLRIFSVKGLHHIALARGVILYMHGHVQRYAAKVDLLDLPPPPDEITFN